MGIAAAKYLGRINIPSLNSQFVCGSCHNNITGKDLVYFSDTQVVCHPGICTEMAVAEEILANSDSVRIEYEMISFNDAIELKRKGNLKPTKLERVFG